jgi:pimeloyl-ACP methyl ester carboxylesterase
MTIKTTSYLENKISGLYAEGSDGTLPLLVMFPGGGSNADAFNLPHASFLKTASDNGYSAIALNRPGPGRQHRVGLGSDGRCRRLRCQRRSLMRGHR